MGAVVLIGRRDNGRGVGRALSGQGAGGRGAFDSLGAAGRNAAASMKRQFVGNRNAGVRKVRRHEQGRCGPLVHEAVDAVFAATMRCNGERLACRRSRVLAVEIGRGRQRMARLRCMRRSDRCCRCIAARRLPLDGQVFPERVDRQQECDQQDEEGSERGKHGDRSHDCDPFANCPRSPDPRRASKPRS